MHPQAVALLLFALAVALVGLLVVGQAIARRLSAEGSDNELLEALGATRGQRFAVNLAVVVVVALWPVPRSPWSSQSWSPQFFRLASRP